MTEQHPITPPPELVQQWMDGLYGEPGQFVSSDDQALATRAAQYGADQELEACCECIAQWYRPQSFLKLNGDDPVPLLRAARRPKPPSLKQQALAVLESVAVHELYGDAKADNRLSADDMKTIRRALEALSDD